jgi:hypothetical protein
MLWNGGMQRMYAYRAANPDQASATLFTEQQLRSMYVSYVSCIAAASVEQYFIKWCRTGAGAQQQPMNRCQIEVDLSSGLSTAAAAEQ